jgi:hypothetical protein
MKNSTSTSRADWCFRFIAEALQFMGFQHLRVLVLPNNFAKDWAEQGYAYEKGK